MLARVVRSVLSGLSIVLVLLSAAELQAAPITAVSAAGSQVTFSKVLLMATLNNGPAMRPVKWQVYRIKDGRSVLVESFKRHSASIELEPGVYRADAVLDSINRSRTFDVRTVSNSNVIVAMD